MKRKCLSAAILLFTVLSLFSCRGGTRRYTASFIGPFDTVTVVTGYTKTEKEFSGLAAELETRLWEYHQLYDIYTDYPGLNNLKTVNDMAGIAPVPVDARIIDLLEYALQMDALTSGGCRVTYGAVLEIWHEYREAGQEKPPADLLAEAAKHTDPSLLVIDREAGTVYLSDPRASLDVGAIAKGYTVEAVCKALSEKGFSDFAANVGGNIRTHGKMNGGDWTLSIRDLEGVTLAASDAALVTSGIYERYYTVNGEHLHHIIDPATNAPAKNWYSISVLAPDSGLADALSTALFTMTAQEGQALIASLSGVEAVWVDTAGKLILSDGISALTAGGDAK